MNSEIRLVSKRQKIRRRHNLRITFSLSPCNEAQSVALAAYRVGSNTVPPILVSR
jgi:hypothetical protein